MNFDDSEFIGRPDDIQLSKSSISRDAKPPTNGYVPTMLNNKVADYDDRELMGIMADLEGNTAVKQQIQQPIQQQQFIQQQQVQQQQNICTCPNCGTKFDSVTNQIMFVQQQVQQPIQQQQTEIPDVYSRRPQRESRKQSKRSSRLDFLD